MARTPARIRELINRQQAQIAHVTDILKTKRTVRLENQADWVKERSEEYFIGFANGVNALPKEVWKALRENGFIVGEEFE